MNPNIHCDPSIEQLSDTAEEAVHCATDKVKEIYHSAARKAANTISTSKEQVRRNPMLFLLGTVAIGAAIGYVIVRAQRKPTFAEQFAENPMESLRETIFTALAPVTQRVHDGYDSAREGVSKAIDHVQHFSQGRGLNSRSNRVRRVASNLKFW